MTTRVTIHCRVMIALSLVPCLFTSGLWASGLALQDARLDPKVLGPECSEIKGQHPVSFQTRTHYATIEDAPAVLFTPPTQKGYQSFKCGKQKSTIYYFVYKDKSDANAAQGFTRGYIWGANGPTKDHPELILARENILIVLSSREPERFLKFLNAEP